MGKLNLQEHQFYGENLMIMKEIPDFRLIAKTFLKVHRYKHRTAQKCRTDDLESGYLTNAYLVSSHAKNLQMLILFKF